jgi:ABC-2 type transport system permease protein
MSMVWRIAREEWRLWLRSKVVVVAALIVAVLLAVTSVLTAGRVADEQSQRMEQQVAAEETFFAQPDRHPHRMVHYGHYAFRPPPPLAVFEPGVDAVTGQSIFLEGHRQNTAMFADTKAAADLGGFAALTPASLYQLLMPLLLIVLGHALFLRERESGTLAVMLAQGQSGVRLAIGKGAALLAVIVIFMIPLVAVAAYAVALGESGLAAGSLVLSYFVYLCVWGAIVLAASTILTQRTVSLGALIFAWLFAALIVPRFAINVSSAAIDAPGKIESDLVMLAEQRKLGDGHDAADPAFKRLEAQVLEQYEAETIEELPINWRGVVASYSEAELTDLMNEYSNKRMGLETSQSRMFDIFGLVSPSIAISSLSRTLSGTDLATHHRFLRESEVLRFDFVQSLNQAHVDDLDYAVDINRSTNEETSRAARINADSWKVLDEFRFTADPASKRLGRAILSVGVLLLWLAVSLGAVFFAARRVKLS